MILLLCFDLPIYGFVNVIKKPRCLEKMKINSTATWTVFSQTYEATKIIASLFKSLGFCKLLSVYF